MTIYEELADQLVRKAIERMSEDLIKDAAQFGAYGNGELRALIKTKCESLLNEPEMQELLRARLVKAIESLPQTLESPQRRY